MLIFENDIVPDRPMVHLKDADAVTFDSCRVTREGSPSRPFDEKRDVSDLPHVRRPPNPGLKRID